MHEGLQAAGFFQTDWMRQTRRSVRGPQTCTKNTGCCCLCNCLLPSARKSNKEERETEFFPPSGFSTYASSLLFPSAHHCVSDIAPPFPPSSSCDAVLCVPPLLCHWPMANCVGSVCLMTWFHTNITQLSMPTSSTDANWCRPAPTVHRVKEEEIVVCPQIYINIKMESVLWALCRGWTATVSVAKLLSAFFCSGLNH